MSRAAHDRATLTLIKSGSESAFLALVDRHHMSLLRVAGLWSSDAELCEDLVSQTWLSMLRRLERFDDKSSLKGWLCKTLISLTRQRLGPEHDAFALPLELPEEGPNVDPDRFSPPGNRWEGHWQKPPTDWASLREPGVLPPAVRADFQAAFAALPRAEHTVLTLRDVEGLSNPEVAAALDIPEPDARTLLHRGRSRLRTVLERYFDAAVDAAVGAST